MPSSDDENARRWMQAWRRAGPALERVRRAELRAFRYEDNYRLVDALLQMACDFGTPRTTSGLVEQQRLFGKLRP